MMRATALMLGVVFFAACVSDSPTYRHNRFDYWAFRARAGRVPEPNYVPWVAHPETLADGTDALILCRWPDAMFPLRYVIDIEPIPESMQDEFHPRNPRDYASAVRRALKTWEEAIGRPVSFLEVDSAEDAVLTIRLKAAGLDMGEGHVLGRVRDQRESCRVVGPNYSPELAAVEFRVDELELYLADAMGLLTPRQVGIVALHELGHVLGASGQHSPLRGDVMFPIANDRRVEELSDHDLNTFRALYKSQPGTLYTRLNISHQDPMAEIRKAPPRLDREIHDERFGFRVQFPKGWQVIESSRGWIAVDGVTWDYDASIQVISLGGSYDEHMQASSRFQRQPGADVSIDEIEIDDRPVGRVIIHAPDHTEIRTVIPWGEDGIILMIADCASENFDLYRPWFQNVLLSIDAEVLGPNPDQ